MLGFSYAKEDTERLHAKGASKERQNFRVN